MFEIRPEVYAKLTQEHFFSLLRRFILEHSLHHELQKAATDAQIWRPLWERLWDSVKNKSQYHAAIRLTFALACQCEDIDADFLSAGVVKLSDMEFEMKSFLADNGYMKFSAFDF